METTTASAGSGADGKASSGSGARRCLSRGGYSRRSREGQSHGVKGAPVSCGFSGRSKRGFRSLGLGVSDGGSSHDQQASKCEAHFVGEKVVRRFFDWARENKADWSVDGSSWKIQQKLISILVGNGLLYSVGLVRMLRNSVNLRTIRLTAWWFFNWRQRLLIRCIERWCLCTIVQLFLMLITQ